MERVGALERVIYADTDGPSSRHAYASAQTLSMERLVVVHGGQGESAEQLFGDTWRFDCLKCEWKLMVRPDIKNFPCARAMHTLTAYLPHRFLMFGGIANPTADDPVDEDNDHRDLDDLWEYDLKNNSWNLIDFATGEKPSKRGGHAGVYGLAADGIPSLFIVGGDSSEIGRIHRLNLHDWKWTIVNTIGVAPPERITASVCFMPSFGGLLVTCGQSDATGGFLGDVWILTLFNKTWKWEQLILDGDIPPRLGASILVLPSASPKVLLWGGAVQNADGEEVWSKDVTIYDIDQRKSESFSPNFLRTPPKCRFLQGAFRFGRDFFVWGGMQSAGRLFDEIQSADMDIEHFKLDNHILYNTKKEIPVLAKVQRVDDKGCLISAVIDDKIYLSHMPNEAIQATRRVSSVPARQGNQVRSEITAVPKVAKVPTRPSEKIVVSKPNKVQSIQQRKPVVAGPSGKRKHGSERKEKKLAQGVFTRASATVASPQPKVNGDQPTKRRRISHTHQEQQKKSQARGSTALKAYVSAGNISSPSPRKRSAADIAVAAELASGNNVLQKQSRTSGATATARKSGLAKRKSAPNPQSDAEMTDVPVDKPRSTGQQQIRPKDIPMANINSKRDAATASGPSSTLPTPRQPPIGIPLTGLQKQIARNPLGVVAGRPEEPRRRNGTAQPRVQQPASVGFNVRSVQQRGNVTSPHRPDAHWAPRIRSVPSPRANSMAHTPTSTPQANSTLPNSISRRRSSTNPITPPNKTRQNQPPSAIAPPRNAVKSPRGPASATALRRKAPVGSPPPVRTPQKNSRASPPSNAAKAPLTASATVPPRKTTPVAPAPATRKPNLKPIPLSAPSFGVTPMPSSPGFGSRSTNSPTFRSGGSSPPFGLASSGGYVATAGAPAQPKTNGKVTQPPRKKTISAIAPPRTKPVQDSRPRMPDAATVSNHPTRPQARPQTVPRPQNPPQTQVQRLEQNNSNNINNKILRPCAQQERQVESENRGRSDRTRIEKPSKRPVLRRLPPTDGEKDAMANTLKLAQPVEFSSDEESDEE